MEKGVNSRPKLSHKKFSWEDLEGLGGEGGGRGDRDGEHM